jgi:peptidoglycan/LPS O-acetylase OafA/YrhL
VRDFARRRGARLLPGYWLTLTLALVLALLTGAAFPGVTEIALQYGAMQQPFRLIDGTATIGFGNAPVWLVSVIVSLYAALALVWRPYLRHPLIGLAVAAAITVAWKLAAVHMTGLFEAIERSSEEGTLVEWDVLDQAPGWVYSFALGMTCAWAYVRLAMSRPREQLERLALRAAPFAVLAFGLCAYLYAETAIDTRSTSGSIVARSSPSLDLAYNTSRAALMAVIVLGPAVLSKPFANRPIRRFADLSYGVYLVHMLVIVYVCEMLLDLPADGGFAEVALWFAIILPLSLAYAYLVYRFAERPTVAWAARRRSRGHVERSRTVGVRDQDRGAVREGA